MIAVNLDFFGKQSSLNDLTKFILVPPHHSLPYDSISQLLINVGRSDGIFIGRGVRPVPQELWTGVTCNFCLSCLCCFSQGAAGFCRLDTEQRLTAVTSESTTTCILQTWTSGTCGSFLCVWYWSRRAVRLDWFGLLDGTDHNMLKAQL